ncbi:hypothetical protein ABGV42_01030 [Paenibacillus pabuli]|uniref:hypothetical protein n=1 Tax=Paenibacillus pabuli TaxID=1472 RepID=UPI003242AE98
MLKSIYKRYEENVNIAPCTVFGAIVFGLNQKKSGTFNYYATPPGIIGYIIQFLDNGEYYALTRDEAFTLSYSYCENNEYKGINNSLYFNNAIHHAKMNHKDGTEHFSLRGIVEGASLLNSETVSDPVAESDAYNVSESEAARERITAIVNGIIPSSDALLKLINDFYLGGALVSAIHELEV